MVVTLDAPPLATAVRQSRVLTARVRTARLDLASPSSAGYLRSLATAQRQLAARITTTIPQASVTWHYQVVLNGLAVYLPRADLARLAATPGVAKVWPNVAYRPLLDRSPQLIGAPQMWGSDFSTAGNGVKIGIVDDGVDQAHPFFNPAGYTMPPGFPKGNAQFTTPKVIAARAFSPPTNTWKYAKTPFDPEQSEHATHVAGIAAGNYSPGAIPGRGPLSGVAPRAYLGNYKVLTVPTENFGLNGNAPEIAAGIEAAVRDGMDVINLSLGEAEIEPSRDLVVAAINAAADAGVVPVIAAGNDFDDFGYGSVSSPGSAAKAITAAAVTKQLGDRVVLERRADARLARDEARRLRPRRRHHLVGSAARGHLGLVQRHEHGDPARRRRGRAPPPAASRLDGRAGEVGARHDRQARADAPRPSCRRRARAAG